MASGWLSASSHRGFLLMLQKNPERESVRHEQQRHDQLNAMLPKKPSCGNMCVSLLSDSVIQRMSPLGEHLARFGDPRLSRRWLDGVLAAPHGGVGCELRL